MQKQQSETSKKAAVAIMQNHYVDNYLDETETLKLILIKDAIYVYSRGDFEIRNFIWNSKEVLANLPENLRTYQTQSEFDKKLNDNDNDSIILNLKFHKISQEIMCGTKIRTKR